MNSIQYFKRYLKATFYKQSLPKPFFIFKKHSTPTDELFLLWHEGLGDSVVCNGLVRYLLTKTQPRRIHLPVHPRCLNSIQFMFSDISAQIIPHTCTNFYEACLLAWNMKWQGSRLLDISMNHPNFSRYYWDQEFYRYAGIPYQERWNSFKIPPVEPIIQLPDKFIFLHDDPDRKLNIRLKTNTPIIRPTNIGHAFLWLPAIQKAEEIHCIDSSFFHIVESVETKTEKLYFHNIRPTAYPASIFRKKWTICKK